QGDQARAEALRARADLLAVGRDVDVGHRRPGTCAGQDCRADTGRHDHGHTHPAAAEMPPHRQSEKLMTEDAQILSTTEGATCFLTLNRPDKRNALGERLIAGLKAGLAAAEADA